MSEAPERIKIESECGHANTYNSEDRRTWLHFPDNAPDYFYAEYVRADHIEKLEAENKLLRDAVYIDDLTVTMQASDRSKAIATIGRALDLLGANMLGEAKTTLRTTLAELTGDKP